jgi:hypothetical protein
MKKAVLLTIVLSKSLNAGPVDNSFSVKPVGTTESTVRIKSASIVIRVITEEKRIGKSFVSHDERKSSCTFARFPCSLVNRLTISVDGRNIFVPRSVFADLSDLNRAHLTENEGVFTLKITAGDASEAYAVVIKFNGKRVMERSITDPVNTDEVLEQTKYFEIKSFD